MAPHTRAPSRLAGLCLSLSLRSRCPGARSGLGEVEGSLLLPWGSQVLCLRSWPRSPLLRLASPVTAKRKKLGDRCQGNVPTVVPSINHWLPGHRALFKTHRWFEVSAAHPASLLICSSETGYRPANHLL